MNPILAEFFKRMGDLPKPVGVSGLKPEQAFGWLPDRVGLYVHFPYCPRVCEVCAYAGIKYEPDQGVRYSRALLRELGMWLPGLSRGKVTSLYFGGGSPILQPDLIRAVTEMVTTPAGLSEVGVELKPGQAGPGILEDLVDLGVTHVNMAIGSFQPEILTALGRNHDPKTILETLDKLLAGGFTCVDVDLTVDIGRFGAEAPLEDARRLFDRGVDQVSLYPLSGFVSQAGAVRRQGGAREERRLLTRIEAAARERGYQRTSVWTFNKDPLRRYATLTREFYVGVGLTASSSLAGAMTVNTFDQGAYFSMIERGLLPAVVTMPLIGKSSIQNYFYWRLQHGNLSRSRFMELFGASPERALPALQLLFKGTGILSGKGDSCFLSPRGMDFFHSLETLISTTMIEPVWNRCREAAYPYQSGGSLPKEAE